MLELIDGTTANIDFSIDSVSLKCQFQSMGIDWVRQSVTRSPTFCQTNWQNHINGMKSINWVATGYLAKGDASTSFGQYHLEDTYPEIEGTFDDGCFVAFTGVVEHDTGGIRAADVSSRVLSGTNHNDDASVTWAVA